MVDVFDWLVRLVGCLRLSGWVLQTVLKVGYLVEWGLLLRLLRLVCVVGLWFGFVWVDWWWVDFGF